MHTIIFYIDFYTVAMTDAIISFVFFTEAQLMLKKDAENADEYAFDNPAFKSMKP